MRRNFHLNIVEIIIERKIHTCSLHNLQTFGNKLMTYGSWVIPIMVAISAFGGLCVHIMASSRMCFVGARNGHMPSVLSLINVKSYTPVPSLVFLVNQLSDYQNEFEHHLIIIFLVHNFSVSSLYLC